MKPKQYLTRKEKNLDFTIGFVGFLILNVVTYFSFSYGFAILMYMVGEELMTETAACAVFILPWAINIGLLLFFAWWRLWVAIGGLCAWAVCIGLPILCGAACLAMCTIGMLADTLRGY